MTAPRPGWLLLRAILVGAAVAGLMAPMFFLSGFVLFQLVSILVHAMAILAIGKLVELSGQFSLGHAAFVALGGYVVAISFTPTGPPFLICLVLAIAACFAAGLAVGRLLAPLEGPALAVGTFALAIIVPSLIKMGAVATWTGGAQGRPVAPLQPPPGLAPDLWLYLVALAVGIAAAAAADMTGRGRFGRLARAVRDDSVAAASVGISPARVRAAMFGASAALAGAAGALGAVSSTYVAPDSFALGLTITLFVGVVVGGPGSTGGALIGGAFVVLVPNLAESLSKGLAWAAYGGMLAAVVLFAPRGLGPLLAGFVRRAVSGFGKT